MNDNLERHLHLVLDGRITWTVFERATRAEFERMALYLLRRWVPPAWYTVEDVVQELLIGTTICVWEWSKSFGPTLSRYVVYNAISYAKRELHRARGAKLSGTADKNPSRFERPLSSFGLEDEGDAIADAILAEEPVAEQTMIDAEEKAERANEGLATALEACTNETERAVIAMVAGAGDVEAGAETFYGDMDYRIGLRLVSEEHALRVVHRTVKAVAKRQTLAS